MREESPAPTLTPTHGGRRARLHGLERLLWILSFSLLATVAWMKLDAWRYQSQASRQWREAQQAGLALSPATEPAGHARSTPASAPAPRVAPGAPLGQLRIPRLDLTVMVAEGTSEEVLQHAVGHLSSSAYPGGAANVVLAGHRDTFFRPLEQVRIGDRIALDDGLRTYEYRVESTEVVSPDRTEVASPGSEPLLTLITCYPFRYLGPAPERFVVRARALPPEDATSKGG